MVKKKKNTKDKDHFLIFLLYGNLPVHTIPALHTQRDFKHPTSEWESPPLIPNYSSTPTPEHDPAHRNTLLRGLGCPRERRTRVCLFGSGHPRQSCHRHRGSLPRSPLWSGQSRNQNLESEVWTPFAYRRQVRRVTYHKTMS